MRVGACYMCRTGTVLGVTLREIGAESCILIHIPHILWSSSGVGAELPAIAGLIGPGLCRILHPNFREFLFCDVG